MNTNEENKTEDRESGIQTYSRKKKSHGNFLKIGCASCGFVAVVALCVLSSRYSWFGVKADDEGISYNNGLASSYSTTAPVEEQKVPTKAIKHNEAQETTVATSATTSVTTTAKTTQTTAATTKATAPATTKATTPATTAAPKPAWTEKKCSGTMYINISSCSARKEGLQGSEVVSYKYYGDAVNIAALTDTGYYKLDDGTYIHSDYLSESKPVRISVAVTNTGKREGVETVQLYIHDCLASLARPVKELKNYQRVTLKPGETKMVEFTLTVEDLKFYNADLKYMYEPGDFEIMVGPDSGHLNVKRIKGI